MSLSCRSQAHARLAPRRSGVPCVTPSPPSASAERRPAVRAAVALGRFYQRYLSALKPPACRFAPTCSEYAVQAVGKYGLLRGAALALRRILRCHPFSAGGEDPLAYRPKGKGSSDP